MISESQPAVLVKSRQVTPIVLLAAALIVNALPWVFQATSISPEREMFNMLAGLYFIILLPLCAAVAMVLLAVAVIFSRGALRVAACVLGGLDLVIVGFFGVIFVMMLA